MKPIKNHINLAMLAASLSFSFFLTACSTDSQVKNSSLNTVSVSKPSINEEDRQAINNLIIAFFNDVDNNNWSDASARMADSVYVDYSALNGDTGFKTPQELTQTWQSFLPGFERVIHHVHNVSVWPVSDRATATFDALSTHYLNGSEWSVFAGYDTEFVKQDGAWVLARIDLSLYEQTGDKQLPQQASRRVAGKQVGTTVKKASPQAVSAVENFFKALEARDLNQFMGTLNADIKQIMPLAPGNFPKLLDGLDAMENQYTGVMTYTQSYDREYFPTNNPNHVLAKYTGTVTTAEGKPYNNSYVGIFETRNGKISTFTEYFNPNVLLSGWPGLQPENFSVHKAGASTNSGVTLQEIRFNSGDATLVGHLFLPPGFDATKQYPASVVTGSWTSVKEQMPDTYASILAENGSIALTFDFTGFGESEGQPRQVEDYAIKIDDIKAAVDFLSAHNNVMKQRISGLGVCASAGYMAHATQRDSRIKNLVLVAPWMHNREIAKSIYDGRPGGTKGLLSAAEQAKKEYALTGEMKYVLAASELDPLSAMYVPENAFDYYLNPAKAAGSIYDNRFAVSAWEPWLTFDGISVGDDITTPVLVVHSEQGAVPHGLKDFYSRLDGEKSITWLNEYTQQDLYHKPEAVDAAMEVVVQYLQ